MSTIGPAAVHHLASVLPSGVGLLDAPVLGSLSEAEDGTLQIFVGGREEVFARCAGFLSTFGKPTRVGPLGAGAAAKLVVNATLFGVLGVLGEAVTASGPIARRCRPTGTPCRWPAGTSRSA
jgi:3-hydroxyisobutyrate dehydrogenase-like beta-hydroxyacid dehydrogenase